MICDPRLRQMGYGRRLQAALPPMGMLTEETEALDWLAMLAGMRDSGSSTRAATTASTPAPWHP